MALLSASMQFDVSSELCRLQPTMLYGAKLLFLNKAPVLKSGSIIKMVIDMVNNAMKKIPNHEGLILHSDQWLHYQHVKYQNTLKKNGIEQNMSRKGNCLDKAMMENFFRIMKTELLYSRQWNSMDEFQKELRKYIYYYNHERIKLRLNGMSPEQYRTYCI